MKIKVIWILCVFLGITSCQDSTQKRNDESYLFSLLDSKQTYRKSELLGSEFGLPVSKEEFQKYWNELPEAIRRSPDIEKNRKRILNRIIEEKLLYKDGLENEVYLEPDIQKAILGFAQKQILKKRMEQIYSALSDPSEAELLSYYEAHTKQFQRPTGASVDLAHFPVTKAIPKEESLRKCRDTLVKLSKGQALDTAIEENRHVPSKSGKNKFIKKGDVPSLVWRTVSRMKHAGELSSQLQTPDGCYIVKLIEKLPPSRIPFVKVKAEIRTLLMREKREEALAKHVEKLKKRH